VSYQPPVTPGPQQPHSPGQPQWGPPPPVQYAPPPRKKSNAGLIIGVVVAVFAVLCVGGGIVAAVGGNPDTTTANTAGGEAPPEEKVDGAAKTYRVGQTVRGGDFEFIVHGAKCGIAQVGNEFLNKKAQGSFCRVDVSAKNVSKKAHYFHADGTVKAKDSTGREFSADGEANIYGNKEGEGFLDEVNPGNQVRAFVYFDVPKGAKLSSIVFDAGLFTLAEDAVITL